jgi:SAM-dependent methyltransferase
MDLTTTGQAASPVGGDAHPGVAQPPRAVVWHDLECGGYTADLPLWRELAATTAGAPPGAGILDVGAGTGRVALDLLARGYDITALDVDAELLAALAMRAENTPPAARGRLTTVCADARGLDPQAVGGHAAPLPPGGFALCLVPMQTLQILGGRAGRAAFLRGARAQLRRDGLLACAIVTAIETFDCRAGDRSPMPERRAIGDVRYASRAVRIAVAAQTTTMERVRTVQAPRSGRLTVQSERDVVTLDRIDAAALEDDATAAGLRARGRRVVAATHAHVETEVVMLGA